VYQYTIQHDQELPARWTGEVLPHRQQSGDPAGAGGEAPRQLTLLDASTSPKDMNVPGWHLHALKGKLKGHWSVRVSGNWRITFKFEGEDAILVDYQDYH
jgi:toxin HigB-1